MAKANSVVSLVKNATARTVTVTVQGFAPLILAASDLTGEIRNEALVHGLGQKMVDSAALSRDTVSGKPATAAEKHAAIQAMFDQLTVEKVWNAEREGGATSILFEALCAMMPDQTPDAIRGILDGLTDAEKRGLPLDSEVAPFYKAVKDARDAKRGAGVDTAAVKAKFKAKATDAPVQS